MLASYRFGYREGISMKLLAWKVIMGVILILTLCVTRACGEIKLYFLDVGEADATLVQCDGESMLIDAGNSDDASYMFSFLYNTMKLRTLDYVIATHPHEDHIGGMAAVLNACDVGTLFSTTEYDESPYFISMLEYAEKQSLPITIPVAGDIFTLGGATVQFISPTYEYGNWNNDSLCVRIDYGNNSFLFTGDAEYWAEDDMLASEYKLAAQVLKVGHHGSNTSSSEAFLRAVMPEYAVMSTAIESEYGNPDPEVILRLRDIGASVLRTDQMGTIICTGDGETLSFETQTVTSDPQYSRYVGNFNSKKFHLRNCESISDMKESNKVFFVSRNAAIEAGYKPCKHCNP